MDLLCSVSAGLFGFLAATENKAKYFEMKQRKRVISTINSSWDQKHA